MTGKGDAQRHFPPTDAEIVREFCAEADAMVATMESEVTAAVHYYRLVGSYEARRELARRLAEAEAARREMWKRAGEQIAEAFARTQEALSDMRGRLENDPPAEAPKAKKRLTVITGRGSGLHLGVVPPGSEAPYSSVPVSLCGIGNNHLLGIRWKKHIPAAGAAICEACAVQRDHLFAADEAEWFDHTVRQPGWQALRPEVRYEFCPVESPDGMRDLPSVRISGDEEASGDGEA